MKFGDHILSDPWENDRLGYKDIGTAFSNLVRSLDTATVISIEAGFGRGKTFFREAWAKQLRSEDQVVIEIDVQQSDHSGDPVVTLLAALLEALPGDARSRTDALVNTAKKTGAVLTRVALKAVFREGANEILEFRSEELEEMDALDGVIRDVGDEMSKLASQMIVSQMAAEKVRSKEMPEQLNALRKALVKGDADKRVVVIIDELDRCHPDYAIAFLEAMKLTFGQSGFLFCLMANPEYLQSLASHRFGVSDREEPYLDKFVDIRLRLEPKGDLLRVAAEDIAKELPMGEPYGDGEEFTLERAVRLAGDLTVATGFSMRKVKRVLQRVELALRFCPDQAFDVPLLVFLAFRDQAPKDEMGRSVVDQKFLPRSFLTPEKGADLMGRYREEFRESGFQAQRGSAVGNMWDELRSNGPELANLPPARYGMSNINGAREWDLVFGNLAPHYIPNHEDALNAVATVMADSAETPVQ